jgi:hypothetical protein
MTLSSCHRVPQCTCSVARKSTRYEAAMSCVWGVGRGACVQVCSVRVPGLQGFLSVYVRSIVVRGSASLSHGVSVRLAVSAEQPAGVSVGPLPATQQSVIKSWQLCKCPRQRLHAAGLPACNRRQLVVSASRAGSRPRRNGAHGISRSRQLMPRHSAFLRSVPTARHQRQGGELQHRHV